MKLNALVKEKTKLELEKLATQDKILALTYQVAARTALEDIRIDFTTVEKFTEAAKKVREISPSCRLMTAWRW